MTFAPVEFGRDEDDEASDSRKTDTDITAVSDGESSPTSPDAIADARLDSLKRLQGGPLPHPNGCDEQPTAESEKLETQNPRTTIGNTIPEAVIVLKEERVRSIVLR